MKAVIFAGGVGTRLWPLSRKKSPKQFEKIIDDKSTLQLTVDRILPYISYRDIYVFTNEDYKDAVKKQLPQIPEFNIFGEPEKKDVGPSVCLAAGYLSRISPEEPFIILWSDHLVKKGEAFLKIIKLAEKIIKEDENKIVLIGQKPRFASQNLGWIKFGREIRKFGKLKLHKFISINYRPEVSEAEKYFKDGNYSWNLGYFVTSPKFLYKLFERFAPRIFEISEQIYKHYGTKKFLSELKNKYKNMPSISFDNAVLEQIDPHSVYVINADLGWTDIGAWEGLKEALAKRQQANVTLGKVILEDSSDNLVYNYESTKTVVGLDLVDAVVVNTKDILLVTRKTTVSKIKKFVEKLSESEDSSLL